MLALVDFVFAVFINSNFFSAAGNFFSLVSASKTLNFFSYRRNQRIFVSRGRVQGFILSRRLGFVVPREIFCPEGRRVSSKSPEGQKISRGTTKPNLRDRINPCTLPRDTKIIWFLRYETISKF